MSDSAESAENALHGIHQGVAMLGRGDGRHEEEARFFLNRPSQEAGRDPYDQSGMAGVRLSADLRVI